MEMLNAQFVAGTVFVAFVGACVAGLTWISSTLIEVDKNVAIMTLKIAANNEKIAELLRQAKELGFTDYELGELLLVSKREYDERKIELERRMTIRVEQFEETWYSKDDIHNRWPKKSKKLALTFPKNMECVTALKSALTYKSGYPAIRWNGSAWVIPNQSEYVSKAVPIFKEFGFTTTELEAITFDAVTQVQGVSAYIEGDTLVLGLERKN